jgi:hypothetical protein
VTISELYNGFDYVQHLREDAKSILMVGTKEDEDWFVKDVIDSDLAMAKFKGNEKHANWLSYCRNQVNKGVW